MGLDGFQVWSEFCGVTAGLQDDGGDVGAGGSVGTGAGADGVVGFSGMSLMGGSLDEDGAVLGAAEDGAAVVSGAGAACVGGGT